MIDSISQEQIIQKQFFSSVEEKNLTFPVIKVECIEERLRQVKKQEGSIVVPKTQMKNHGWFAICQEKKGRVFAIFEQH